MTDSHSDGASVDRLRRIARPLDGGAADYDPVLALIGDAGLALLGAASHGTREFHTARAAITRRLIEEKGFAAVAVEADWAPSRRVDRYVAGAGEDQDAGAALGDFQAFPAWMWRNREVAEFVEWLRRHNDALPARARKVGFYGLDLYHFGPALDAVLAYLEKLDPAAAARARDGYACLDAFRDDPGGYSTLMASELAGSCKAGAARGLVELYESAAAKRERSAGAAAAALFDAEQSARVVKSAEEYYRHMVGNEAKAWNARARHMAETVDGLAAYLDPRSGRGKLVVWAHNAHLGDARATEMREEREISVGQLVRKGHGAGAVLIGLDTHHGTVLAAPDWEQPGEIKAVPPARDGSYEALFHATGLPRFFFSCRERGAPAALGRARRERAIGVVYRADDYLTARMPRQFDGLLHFDETRAVEALDGAAAARSGAPETFPFGV